MRTAKVLLAAALVAVLAIVPCRAGAALPKANQVVTISGVALEHPLSAAQPDAIEISAQILPGWHINSDRPLDSDYIPTRVTLKLPAGITLSAIQYPPAQEAKLDFSREKLAVFTGAIQIKATVTPAPDFKPSAELPMTVSFEYQACNNIQCLQPTLISKTADLNSPIAPLQVIDHTGDNAAAEDAAAPHSEIADTFLSHGYLFGFLIVFLGGLALNLTPCVYPLIGVTIAYFGREDSGSRRVLTLAILYVAGIAITFSVLGVGAALSGGLFGAALEQPLVLAAIAAMLLALAASSFGLFQLQPPQWLMRTTGTARPGYLGAAVMGLGMGVVAAPCIGPLVFGLLLLVERSRSPLFGFSLFFTLALGMGLPYIALALAARSIRKLPRSGEWLQWIEHLFGFVLAGLALYFLDPVIPYRLIDRLLPFYAIAAAFYLGFVSRAGNVWRPFRILKLGIGALSVVGLIYLLMPKPAPAELVFRPFDNTLLASAEARRAPVVIDFSADWCIPCREMERTTFADPAVVNEASRFLALRADLTRQDENSEELRSRYKIDGVPTALFIDSHGKVAKRLVGYAGAGEFLKTLRQVD
ncbi:MAG TPA: cytochrome c biogenesis protein CcdA [Candidatus Binataceae bacterium]|nr:cytochrome c biogenesis protein CcdA [Candidatus Binataceae bacterium]